jgi:hypothetical protein
MVAAKKKQKAKRTSRTKSAGASPKYYFCEIYRTHIFYYIGHTQDEMLKHAKEHLEWDIDPTDGVGACHSLEWEDDKEQQHYLAIWSKKDKDVFTVSHECLRAAHFIMERIGTKRLDDEPTVYLYEEIFKKAWA